MKFFTSLVQLSAASLVVAAPKLKLPFSSKNSTDYLVSSRVPGIPFDLGPSWAGLMPLNGKSSDPRKFFFWMFPSESEVGQDDLTIWLNGGPGCSSLEGLMQENGPFALPFNSTEVVKSNYSWTKLSNVLWVEQPVSVGLGTGKSVATNEDQISTDFRDFLDSFMEVFPEMKNKKLWITGESYAGKYIPYIADKIYQRSDSVNKKHGLNLQGIAINDPSFVNDYFGEDLPSVEYVLENNQYFGFNTSVIQQLKDDAEKNGMTDFVKENLNYPPKGPIQLPKQYDTKHYRPWDDIASLASEVNPNFNVYNIKDSKLIQDPLGYPPADAEPSKNNFINNVKGFKEAVHADPKKTWLECVDGVLDRDSSLPPSESVLPGVIAKSAKTIIQHGLLDFVLIGTGSQLGIQNMTWGGKQGFQTKPNSSVVIDGKDEGIYHTERGLSFVQTPTGHMVPQDFPEFGFKLQKFLLGQISEEDLSKICFASSFN